MSTDYFLACHACKRITPIASDSSLSGWKWFCDPDKGPVWFIGAHSSHLEAIGVVREGSLAWEDYEVIVEWEGDYEAAKVTGLPENCHPASGEMTILVVRREDNGHSYEPTTKQEEFLREKAWEEYHGS